jgi:hypothetical protein
MEICSVTSDKQQAGVRISKDLLLKARHIAVDRGTTLNDIVEVALLEWYGRQTEREKYGPAEPSKPTKAGRPIKV